MAKRWTVMNCTNKRLELCGDGLWSSPALFDASDQPAILESGKVKRLPEPRAAVLLIVSREVFTALPDRQDLAVMRFPVETENGSFQAAQLILRSEVHLPRAERTPQHWGAERRIQEYELHDAPAHIPWHQHYARLG